TGGIVTAARRQVLRARLGHSRKARSLVKQIRTSRRRLLSHSIAMELAVRPGLAATNAAVTSSGLSVSGDVRSEYCGGTLTTARALRTVSKYAPGSRPEQVPCSSHSW